MEKWTLSSASVEAEVIATGAMLGPVSFRLPSGRLVEPLAQITFTLELFPRHPCSIAFGVHPVFEIGEQPQETELELPFRFGRTFPGDYAPGISHLMQDARFTSLASVPTRNGPTLDLGRHPLPFPTPEVVQLCDTEGWARLRRQSGGYAVSLHSDKQQFPSVVLGIANTGRAAAPFDSRWRALYLEPVAAAFGIGSTVGSNPENPIAKEGIATALELSPAVPWRTSYRIDVEAL